METSTSTSETEQTAGSAAQERRSTPNRSRPNYRGPHKIGGAGEHQQQPQMLVHKGYFNAFPDDFNMKDLK
eukprot:CAMPEP_0178907196 /NCGR_PEP_ID=MMETSP0786-20121207/7237_1 /TAXON_ID=186022 /ORGANISM="Thalassionema frauenfeldii, Strain CCMP 1798" /LENGTH=70 /DNA_ID=CAMNT_0020578969 /DNA_START=89 /DNA_END=301 /DNA_ORIENTATION=+